MPSTLKKELSNSRDALLAAAERLFVDRGFAAVSTREIADEAQVNLGAIQYHFGSKGRLFVETVRQMMERDACASSEVLNFGPMNSEFEAAVQLAGFIRVYLDRLLHPTGPQVCRLVFREILSDPAKDREVFDALLDSIVENFSRPLVGTLSGIIRALCPSISESELCFSTHSVLGQCSFYVTHGPFIEKMRGEKFGDCELFEELVRNIVSFSLRGLGCEEAIIKHAIEKLPKAVVEENLRILNYNC